MNRTIRIDQTKTLTGTLIALTALAAGLLAPFTASAALLLPKIPLFVNISTTPNIFLEMDDSGSMDWDILMPTHFTTCRYNKRKGCSTLERTGEFYDWTGQYSNGNKVFRTFEYVEHSDDDAYSVGCSGSSRQAVERCNSRTGTAPWDWRVRSASLNVLFFNPAIDYLPWPGYSNASFSSTHSYPDPALSGYNDTDNMAGFVYNYWIDDKGFNGSRPDKTDDNTLPNGIVDEWDSHVEVTVDAGLYTCKLYNYAPDDNGLNPTITVLDGTDSRCTAALGTNGSVSQLQQNVANWFQYYRRRAMVARASVARVVTDLPSFRYGFSLINDYDDVFVEQPGPLVNDYTTHNANLIKEYLTHPQKAYGTPLRRGL